MTNTEVCGWGGKRLAHSGANFTYRNHPLVIGKTESYSFRRKEVPFPHTVGHAARLNDNAILASLDYAIGKAYTAIAMNMDTANLTPYVHPGQPLYGLQVGHQPRPLVVFAGGLPLQMNGQLVGGVGVSGGLPDQDGQVAAAVEGLKA